MSDGKPPARTTRLVHRAPLLALRGLTQPSAVTAQQLGEQRITHRRSPSSTKTTGLVQILGAGNGPGVGVVDEGGACLQSCSTVCVTGVGRGMRFDMRSLKMRWARAAGAGLLLAAVGAGVLGIVGASVAGATGGSSNITTSGTLVCYSTPFASYHVGGTFIPACHDAVGTIPPVTITSTTGACTTFKTTEGSTVIEFVKVGRCAWQIRYTSTGVGASGQITQATNVVATTPTPPKTPTPPTEGYRLASSNGAVRCFGDAACYGTLPGMGIVPNKPIVGIASPPTGGGYSLVASDGGIFTFGNAAFYGSMGGHPLNKPVVGIGAMPTGKGYYEVASDGGIFTFGSAKFDGSLGGTAIPAPVVGMATDPSSGGYWIATADGNVYGETAPVYSGSTISGVMGITATD